ncbi:outer membrane protein assembly factor BamB [Sulfuricystis multivorans]|uniref:outer membrane protein assembly factor BamB n=1 Tax=Sulfuricystis multivorans TaxID=2211108 RepID=UPI000F837036|nr:outer membrane protein assembly factor BamB [Sulfuricystis multivorans]
MRFSALLLSCATVLLAGCAALSDTVDAINPFSKSVPKAKPAPLPVIQPQAEIGRLWQASIGKAGEYALTPAVVGESVYAAARDGTLARFDAGRQVWRIETGKPLSGGVGASDQLVVVGTPKGEVLAFHARDGKLAWQAQVSSEILASPALAGDLVVVRSADAHIFAFDAASGLRRWLYQRPLPTLVLRSTAGVVLTDKAVFAGFPGGKLVAIARGNGAALWESTVALPRGTTELERIADVASDPVVEMATVCAVAYQGRLACFDSDNGRQLWARDISSVAGLDIGQRAIFVTDEKGVVHAFERNGGATLWKQDKLRLRGVGRPLALDRKVVVGDFEGYLHVLAEDDGSFLARSSTDGSPLLAPLRRMAAENFVVQTRNGGIFAFALR